MGKISLDRVLPLLVGQPTSEVITLIREGILLQSKLENLEDQSYYFQLGQESHQFKLVRMKSNYNQISEFVNSNDVDYFILKIVELENELIKKKSEGHMGFIKSIGCGWIQDDINYHKDLLQVKNQFGILKSFDELVEDEEFMLKIFSL